MLDNREGPKEITIPESKYKSCSDCKFYQKRMVRSGMNPLYRADCYHHEAEPKPMKLSFVGNLTEGDKTPIWCPFLVVKSN